jgi:hypothetical protein
MLMLREEDTTGHGRGAGKAAGMGTALSLNPEPVMASLMAER